MSLGKVLDFLKMTEGTPADNAYSSSGDLKVAQGIPSRAELARQGRIFTVTTAAGTAIPPVVAHPTLTATFFLYNGNPKSGTRGLYVLDVWAWLESGTAGLGGTLITAVTLAEQTTVPSAYSGTVKSGTSGKNGSDTGGILANAHTITGGQPAWRGVEAKDMLAANAVGAGIRAVLDGDTLVKPGFGMAITLLCETGSTALYGFGVTFADLDMPFE